MDRADLANLNSFVAIADQRSFRGAASRLGNRCWPTPAPAASAGNRSNRPCAGESEPGAAASVGLAANLCNEPFGRYGGRRTDMGSLLVDSRGTERHVLRQASLNARSMFRSARVGAPRLVKAWFCRL